MRKIKTCFYFFCCLIPVLSFSQLTDNTASFRNMTGDHYFRFHYDNDFFNATDYYYTQGIAFEFVFPSLKSFTLTKGLLRLKNSNVEYGISVEHTAYTPTSIRHNEILYSDRPFAACILLKTFSISVDTLRRTRLSSAFSTGALGPAAFGEWMQKTIHRLLKNLEPLGWQNQIQNDVILNYGLDHEKQLYAYRNFFSFTTNAQIRIGTLSDKAQIGLTATVGMFHSPFSGVEKKSENHFQFYFYCQPMLSFIGYDATLQGGLLNHRSHYTLTPDEIMRMTFQNTAGFVLTYKRLLIAYYQSIVSKEFKTGSPHRWCGIKIGLVI